MAVKNRWSFSRHEGPEPAYRRARGTLQPKCVLLRERSSLKGQVCVLLIEDVKEDLCSSSVLVEGSF